MKLKEDIYNSLKDYLEKKNIEIDENKIYSMIKNGNDNFKSDASIACFAIAKDVKMSPNDIAEDIKENIPEIANVSKLETAGPYLNIYLDRPKYSKESLEKVINLDLRDPESIGKVVVIDFSSPNIAKEFHIGHLKTTIIGAALSNMYEAIGYRSIGVNHLGDYGTQFGKLVEGYKRWKDEYNFENPIQDLTDIYIRINELTKEDEEAKKASIDNFKKLEKGDEEVTKIWKMFVDLSLKEFNRIYDYLEVEFDVIKGESEYAKDMPVVVEELRKKGLLEESKGLQVVNLEDEGLGVVVIQKQNGSSMYITRDIAAFAHRAKEYDFDKSLYVVASEQIQHFKQLFKIMEKLGLDKKYIDGAKHVAYGMVSLPEGKMSTRLGNVVKVQDLLKEAVERVMEKLDEKDNLTDEEKQKVAKDVGVGAVKFYNLSTQLIKDQVFIWDNVLDYTGDSGPYVQYTNARIMSILRDYNEKYGNLKDYSLKDELSKVTDDKFNEEDVFNLVKKIAEFKDTLIDATEKYEPYILTSYLIELSKAFNQYYNNNRILSDDTDTRKVGIILSVLVSDVLTKGMNILGINMPDKM